jgi:hypothetical protein
MVDMIVHSLSHCGIRALVSSFVGIVWFWRLPLPLGGRVFCTAGASRFGPSCMFIY